MMTEARREKRIREMLTALSDLTDEEARELFEFVLTLRQNGEREQEPEF